MRALPKSRELKSFYTITADDSEGRLARALRICVGNELRNIYGDLLNEPIPPKFADLLHRLDE
jgi:Anti-sigma factor NepR